MPLSQRAAWVGVWAWAGVMACGSRTGLLMGTGSSDGENDSGASSGSGGSGGSNSSSGVSMIEAGPSEASAPLPPPIVVSLGGAFTCALLDGGTVACWGVNQSGELGDGTSSGPQDCYGVPGCSPTPVAVADLTGATAISAGDLHACALLAGGTVECWGWNGYGQLGDGTPNGQTCSYGTCSTMPVPVSGLTGATAISAGHGDTCALIEGGTVACWGDNSVGELGDGTTSGPQMCNPPGYPGGACSPAPVVVPGLTGATAVSAGYQYECALLAGGTVECWGANGHGQLGVDGTSSGPQTCGSTPCSTTPVAVPGVTGATAISVGTYHACALLSGGTVMCWGWDAEGSLGDGTTNGSSPVAVSGLTGATAIAAGWGSTCALLAGGTVACWGDNTYGELGDGTSTGPQTCPNNMSSPIPCSPTPVVVADLTGVTAISTGYLRTCARLSGGTVVCWGFNVDGVLGDGTTTGPQDCNGGTPCSTTPVEVSSL